MDFNVTTVVQTKAQMEELLRDIDLLNDSLYRTGDLGYKVQLRTNVRISTAEIFSKLNGSREDIKWSLESLKNELLQLELFQITLAVEPSQKFVQQMADWVRENISQKAVLDLSVDLSLLGGAQMSYRGKYVDLSLKKKYESI